MRLWHIKCNGYRIAEASGKSAAVKSLEKILQWDGIDKKDCRWINNKPPVINEITVFVDNRGLIYTIEQAL